MTEEEDPAPSYDETMACDDVAVSWAIERVSVDPLSKVTVDLLEIRLEISEAPPPWVIGVSADTEPGLLDPDESSPFLEFSELELATELESEPLE